MYHIFGVKGYRLTEVLDYFVGFPEYFLSEGFVVLPGEEGPLEPVAVEAAHGLHILSGFALHFLQAG